MSLSRDISEFATAAAKRYDHGELTKLHILFGIRRKFPDQLSQLSIEVLEKSLLNLKSKPTNSLVVSPDVETLLPSLESIEPALQLAVRLSKELLDLEIRLTTEVEVEEQSSGNVQGISLEESLKKLNSLVGLSEVKGQVTKLINVHQANNLRVEEGLPRIPIGLHCVFTGSPGTGKTTVARYLAEMYFAIGLLPSRNVYEVDRASLVAGYVGQTALKVQDAVEKAKGGVLFIDEAYSLSSDSGAGFGDEAISTLVKAMEDHRDNLAVVVAGYKDPMKNFIESNQGLKSRFQNYIDFPDYKSDELLAIFDALCDSNKVKVNAETRRAINSHILSVNPKGEHGNARYMRNLFEKMFLNMSNRAASDGKIEISEVVEFAPEDIPVVEQKKPSIGFTS